MRKKEKISSFKLVRNDLKPSDEKIKIFTYKGSLIMLLFTIAATWIGPAFLEILGMDRKLSLVISSTLIGGFGIAYVRNFIESKKGFNKGFIIQMICFGAAFLIISYYWTYYQYYI